MVQKSKFIAYDLAGTEMRSVGRFAQADSVIPASQGTQAWDRYAFVNNNPVRYTDPTGHGVDCGVGGNEPCPDEPPDKTYCEDPQASNYSTEGICTYSGDESNSDSVGANLPMNISFPIYSDPYYLFLGGINIQGQVAITAIDGSSTSFTYDQNGKPVFRQNIDLGNNTSATFTSLGNFGYTKTAQGEILSGVTGLEFNPWNASLTSRIGVQTDSVAITTSITMQYSFRPDNTLPILVPVAIVLGGIVSLPSVFAVGGVSIPALAR